MREPRIMSKNVQKHVLWIKAYDREQQYGIEVNRFD